MILSAQMICHIKHELKVTSLIDQFPYLTLRPWSTARRLLISHLFLVEELCIIF